MDSSITLFKTTAGQDQYFSSAELSELKQFCEMLLEAWHVPGLAVAVVKDSQLILCEGYGVRHMDNPTPITPDTLFPIASCTKAFTAMSLGLLVDAGRLEWDRPLKHYMPTFKMWDAFTTERLTPHDLLSHRSGLPGHDMLWYASNFDRREIFKRLQFLEPNCDLRTTFQYQNLMYTITGLLVEEISGMRWEDFVQKQIFNPLGMIRSNFSTAITQQSANFASPHFYRADQLKAIPFLQQNEQVHGTGAAGNICSCVEDLAKWLGLHLNHGKIGDQELVSRETLEQMHTPHIFIDDKIGRDRFGYEFTSYGLGWGMHSYKGQFLVEHDGMTDGFYSLISFMPRRQIGIVALSNCDAYYNPVQTNRVPDIITNTLYDRLLGLDLTDWNKLIRAVYEEQEMAAGQSQAGQASTTDRVDAPMSHPIEAYLGKYEHPGYGIVSIQKAGEQLEMVFNEKLPLPLEHCYYDIFDAIFEMINQRQKISFLTDLDGSISQIAIAMEPKVNEIVFRRMKGESNNSHP
jgi:CubicO group peptidase (beta-lactamase class C family)